MCKRDSRSGDHLEVLEHLFSPSVKALCRGVDVVEGSVSLDAFFFCGAYERGGPEQGLESMQGEDAADCKPVARDHIMQQKRRTKHISVDSAGGSIAQAVHPGFDAPVIIIDLHRPQPIRQA